MQQYDIFISYRTTHADWVETLALNLKAQGYKVFLDRWEVVAGNRVVADLYEGLKHSKQAILIAAPDTVDSSWVQDEYDLMLARKNSGDGFRFIPVVIGDFPDFPFLKNVQAVDFGGYFDDRNPTLYRQAFQRRIAMWFMTILILLTLLSLWFLRRYRHPLVVSISANPALLFEQPPAQLKQARTRLKQTNRLDTVLSNNHITGKILDTAIAFFDCSFASSFDKGSNEQQLAILAKRLGGEILPMADSVADDSGLWLREIRLSADFPLNVSHCLFCFVPPDSPPQSVINTLNNNPDKTRLQITCLIAQTSDDQQNKQQPLYQLTQDRNNNIITPSVVALTRLLLDPSPQNVLAGVMAEQMALTQLSPYQLGGGVNREAIFFGRQEIIAHVMNREPANYLQVSGRQLGKSSILKALERRYQNMPNINCLYLSLANKVLIPRLASRLKLPKQAGIESITEHVVASEGRFLFLIDEADKFVRHELQNDYRILDAMGAMSEEGHCQFIIAGFWELYEQAVLDYQSPLKNFAEVIQLGELE